MKIKRIRKTKSKNNKLKDDPQTWAFKQIGNYASKLSIQDNNIVKLSWPKISTTIYPKQTLRVNTGWSSAQLPSNSTLTTLPNKSLISNNLIAVPEVLGASNQGQELVQVVSNNNDFPVQVQYRQLENGDDEFTLHRIHPQTLLSEQILQFDFDQFLSGAMNLAGHILPLIL